MHSEEDKQLIVQAKKDPDSFGKLYDKYFDRILNYTFRRTGDFDLANDITSEVFLKAYANLWKFQWRNLPFSAWLYRVATNEVTRYFRNRSYHAELSEELNLKGIAEYDLRRYEQEKIEAEIRLNQNENFIKTLKIIKTLPTNYQEVIALRYFEQRSLKEICQILNKKEGTIKSLLSRGLEKIRMNW